MALDLTVLLQRKAKLESDIARAKKAKTDARRREDSRRKIVLGSVVLAAVRKGGIREESVRGLIAKFAADRDKAVFDGFVFEVGEAETVTSVSEAAQASVDATRE